MGVFFSPSKIRQSPNSVSSCMLAVQHLINVFTVKAETYAVFVDNIP